MAVAVVSCGNSESATPAVDPSSDHGEQRFPDVVDVLIEPLGDAEYRVAVTLSSPYDTPERYADAWRVLDPEGAELGVRVLTHDHAGEQPFTRDATVTIPDDVDVITVEGRDLVNGYGGSSRTAEVPARTAG